MSDNSDSGPRFLARTGGRRGDYTHQPIDPLGAGEALSEEDQRIVTQQSRNKADAARRDGIEQLLEEARREVEYIAGLHRHAVKKMGRLERRFQRANGRNPGN